jgi:hypothetical protein
MKVQYDITDIALKEISDLCGIQKNITFHLARRPFATTTTLSKSFQRINAI